MNLIEEIEKVRKEYVALYGEEATAEIMYKTVYCGRHLSFEEFNKIIDDILIRRGLPCK